MHYRHGRKAWRGGGGVTCPPSNASLGGGGGARQPPEEDTREIELQVDVLRHLQLHRLNDGQLVQKVLKVGLRPELLLHERPEPLLMRRLERLVALHIEVPQGAVQLVLGGGPGVGLLQQLPPVVAEADGPQEVSDFGDDAADVIDEALDGLDPIKRGAGGRMGDGRLPWGWGALTLQSSCFTNRTQNGGGGGGGCNQEGSNPIANNCGKNCGQLRKIAGNGDGAQQEYPGGGYQNACHTRDNLPLVRQACAD